ncbi:MAG: hypothetical protein JRI25_18335 [Deltaproteobacteria bacterium]|nr:hypothetical protein [Deltaproteobacteria bacterium]
MLQPRILLTNPSYPYPTLPANDSLTDATGQRFTKGDDVFTIISHTHCYANHILAQNVEIPATVLEYPRWDDFTEEVDRGYPIIGISAYPPHLDTVMKMCRYIRRRSPATKILLGSYGGMAFRAATDRETRRQYVDHVVHGEGVRWLRRFLGEDLDRPIRQALMPKAGGSLPCISRFPTGNIGFLVSGLGCAGGCDFCSTTTLFNRQRVEMLSPEELVEHIQLYHRHYPQVSQVFVIEEDHFREPEYLARTRELWQSDPSVLERLDWFGFGSVDYIGKFAETYGWDAIAECGIGCIFIGVESKFAGEHGYDKRQEVDAREVFSRLHAMGIRTVGAWMCGWDFHHHGNIHEDLNYLVSLHPTYQQLTRVSPFPGTPLWGRLKKEDRIYDVPWEDVHFWSGAQKNVALEPHETLNFTEYGYDLLYRTWGPSILRRLEVQLSGCDYARHSANPVLRKHRTRFFKRQCAMLWTMLPSLDRYAPNGVVRRRVRKADELYRALFGEPTRVMKVLSKSVDAMVTAYQVREFFDPLNRHPKEEPYKRYLYEKNGHQGSPVAYTVEVARAPLRTRTAMRSERVLHAALSRALQAARFGAGRHSDPEIDDHLITQIRSSLLGIGF